MKTPVFTGTCTALITPFQASGSIDYAAFARQMDRQLESGVDALCVCGTTGESSTLTVQEHVHLVDYCVSHVAGRCKVVAGSGSNDTAAALSVSMPRNPAQTPFFWSPPIIIKPRKPA